jgi:carboxyl-terminal processing protease
MPFRRRSVISLLLFATLAAALFMPGQSPKAAAQTPAISQANSQVDVVKAAYDNLMDLYYKPLSPSVLLNAGWNGMSGSARSAGLTAPQALGTLSDSRDDAFNAFKSQFTNYLSSLPSDASMQNLSFAMIRGMASSLSDDHTNFLSPSSYSTFLSELGGGDLPVGFGVQTTGAPPWIVTGVAPDGPAAKAGIQPGDEIISSDGQDLRTASSASFAAATGGPAGTTHQLTVRRSTGDVTVGVTRDTYYFPPLSSKLLSGNVGYIAVDHFADAGLTLPNGTEFLSDFDKRLSDLDTQGASGLILDLRGNPGGDSLAAEELLGRFLPASSETDLRFDDRGHQALGIVAGPMHSVQLPMVVLVNGGSASSSELVASTLKEAGRAVLVGEKTAGALATSEILPLPQSAGLQVDVAAQVTAKDGYQIDGAGFPVDVAVADTRTSSDYRSGRDPQLQAAINALAEAPAPPAVDAQSTISKQRLSALLSPYMPPANQLPTNDRLTTAVTTETLELNEPNEWLDTFGFGGRDPHGGQQTLRSRGWLGSHVQNYNLAPLVPPGVSVVIDLYATPEGAHAAVTSNDFPDQQELLPSPVQLGDESTAARGIWLDLGSTAISWRHGNVVLNVGYGDVPGYDRMDTLVSIAKLVDQIYTANPLPADLTGALNSPQSMAPQASQPARALNGPKVSPLVG